MLIPNFRNFRSEVNGIAELERVVRSAIHNSCALKNPIYLKDHFEIDTDSELETATSMPVSEPVKSESKAVFSDSDFFSESKVKSQK